AGGIVRLFAAARERQCAEVELREALLAAVAGAPPGHGHYALTTARDSTHGPPMTAPRQPFWGWPGWKHLGRTFLLGTLFGLWFALVFAGANHVTALHAYRVRLHLDAELAMPFVPAAVLGYLSIYTLFWMAPFILRT